MNGSERESRNFRHKDCSTCCVRAAAVTKVTFAFIFMGKSVNMVEIVAENGHSVMVTVVC